MLPTWKTKIIEFQTLNWQKSLLDSLTRRSWASFNGLYFSNSGLIQNTYLQRSAFHCHGCQQYSPMLPNWKTKIVEFQTLNCPNSLLDSLTGRSLASFCVRSSRNESPKALYFDWFLRLLVVYTRIWVLPSWLPAISSHVTNLKNKDCRISNPRLAKVIAGSSWIA